MQKFFIFICCIFIQFIYSQSKNVGYYVDHQGNKIQATFLWQETRNTPTSFTIYEEGKEKRKLENTEFSKVCINDQFTFIKTTVEVDEHPHNQNFLEYNSAIITAPKELILEEVLQGKISLYKYSGSQATRFFYKNNDEAYVLLQYKPYKTIKDDVEYFNYNNEFLTQLKELSLKNGINIENEITNNIRYNESDLIKIFEKMNSKLGVVYQKKPNNFGYYLKPFVQNYQFESSVVNRFGTFDFGTKNKFIFGLETELELPYYKKLVSFIGNINYFSYSDSGNFYQVPTGMVYARDFAINLKSSLLYTTWGIQFNLINRKSIKAFVAQPIFIIPIAGKSETKTTVENMTSDEGYSVNEFPYGTSLGVQYKNVELAYRLGKNKLGFILKYSFKLNKKK